MVSYCELLICLLLTTSFKRSLRYYQKTTLGTSRRTWHGMTVHRPSSVGHVNNTRNARSRFDQEYINGFCYDGVPLKASVSLRRVIVLIDHRAYTANFLSSTRLLQPKLGMNQAHIPYTWLNISFRRVLVASLEKCYALSIYIYKSGEMLARDGSYVPVG